MAGSMRSVLSDMFREAIVEGRISQNPVTPTRAPKIVVTRERLKLKNIQLHQGGSRSTSGMVPISYGLSPCNRTTSRRHNEYAVQ